MSTIAVEDLMHVSERVFGTRESTLESEAADMEVADLKHTVLVIRRVLASAAVALPEFAYEAQPDDPDGNDVWSAGEVVSHIAGTMIWTDANLRKIRGEEELPPNDQLLPYTEVKVRSKDESLQALEVADQELQRILDDIPDDVDTARTIDHDTFGEVGVKGWLLLTALHEGDHAMQLRELGR